jgi:PAS domain S-box-containing protein
MNSQSTQSNHFSNRRRRAEEIVKSKTVQSSDPPRTLLPEEASQSPHELQVHQIELEMQNEERFSNAFKYAAIGMALVSTEGTFLRVNRALCGLLGYTTKELTALTFQAITHPDDLKADLAYVQQMLEGKINTYQMEKRYRGKQGNLVWVLLSVSLVKDKQKQPLYFISQIQDITDRKLTEEALKESQQRLELAYRSAGAATWDWDLVGQHQIWSRELFIMFGLDPDKDKPSLNTWRRVLHPEDREHALHRIEQAINSKAPLNLEYRVVHASGPERWISALGSATYDSAGKPVRFSGLCTDITERKWAETEREKLESQNRQLQKAESLGRMAGAIAHHFNNQLQAVMMNLECALHNQTQGEVSAENLAEAMRTARKAADVSSLMLTYLGQAPAQHTPLDLSEVGRNHLAMIRATLPSYVTLETNFATPGLVINANVNQIQQVLTNLITNACEALVEGRGGIRLTVQAAPPTAIPSMHRFPIDWRPRAPAYACLEVADEGCGIAPYDIEKLFDPFFSNKFIGRGLGLSVVLGIVRAHHGVITVESKRRKGSVFRVYFPVLGETMPRKAESVTLVSNFGEGRTVLLVEDEPVVRRAVMLALSRFGFTVLTAANGYEGLELFRRHANKVCVVLCDLTMPRMDGWQTLAALRQLSPNIPVILSSGYGEAQAMSGQHEEQPQAFLSKPYVFEELRSTLAKVLEKGK